MLEVQILDVREGALSRPGPGLPLTSNIQNLRSLVHKPSHTDVHDDAEREEGEQDRGASVAHQGQGDAGDGHQADAHPYIDSHLEEQNADDAHDQQAAWSVGGGLGVLDKSYQDEEVEQENDGGASEAMLLAEGGEDEVGVRNGQEVALGLAAFVGSLPPDTAGADGD